MQVQEPVDRPEHAVRLEPASGAERVRAGHEGATRGDRRDPEPQHRYQGDPDADDPPHLGDRPPGPDRVEGQEWPHLGPPERGQGAEHERPPATARQMAVDRAETQRDDHRVGLGAQHVVPPVADPQQRHPGEDPGRERRVAPRPVGLRHRPQRDAMDDPARRDRSAERHRDAGDHPQPQLVAAEQGEREGEQERKRLPRRRRVRVERAGQGLMSPHQPAVRVEARSRSCPQHDPGGHGEDHDAPDQSRAQRRGEAGGRAFRRASLGPRP